ncbi:MAG: bifunctional 4-hydroxy-2-oxoglutarate aldolase/2-dehydro-3-deoxy-phosphogluconate aldolase [Candidatus Gastranaerophilales bacterium]|nr:bifunctional 4-hydroxy-2-oxoglutarate aldolase/2-dehydro-3-deoxy-phosphogluconate aldolase [Candidatus Gastranaerophilales bacterium]
MSAIDEILKQKIFGVVRVTDADKAVQISEALIKGGINIIEIIVQNAEILESIKYLKKNSKALIAAGGIITQRQASISISSGADVVVSPVFQMNLVRLCQNKKIPLIMTATTPNEAYSAWKARTPLIKIYPTKPMGGATYVEDLLRPMPFLNIIATGNIEIDDFTDYLDAGAKAVGIGRSFYKSASAEEITYRAMKAVETRNIYISK